MGDNRNLCPRCGHHFVQRVPSDLKVLLGHGLLQGTFLKNGTTHELVTTVVFTFDLRCGRCKSIMASHVERLEVKADVSAHVATCTKVPRFQVVAGSRAITPVGSEKVGKAWKLDAVLDVVCDCRKRVLEAGIDFPISAKVRTSQMTDQR